MLDFKRGIRCFFSERGARRKNGERPFMEYDPDKRYRILNNVLIIVSSSVLIYTIVRIFQKQNTGLIALMYKERQAGVVSMAFSIICITGNAALRMRLPFFAPALIPVILFAANSLAYFRLGFEDGFSSLWIFVIPPLIYFTAGKKIGFFVSLAVFAGIMLLLFFPRFSVYYYSQEKNLRIITIYLLLFFAAHIYEHARNSKEKNLEKDKSL